MKRLNLKWFNRPKEEIGIDSIMIATHKGDVSYNRYVKFKQLAPQFWERMDSPLLAVTMEKIDDAFNNSNFMKGYAAMKDYELSIKQAKNNYDAWGLCFALICYEKDEDVKTELNDVELNEKLQRLAKKGLTADTIKECVVNFMKASPETFQDHLILLEAANMMTGTEL